MNDDEYEGEAFDDGADAFANVGQGLVDEHKTAMLQYWQQAIDDIERISEDGQETDVFKSTVLPLARIKKVMKTDSEVRMISAEAPILFAKGCDIFITELTMRAWIHAEENKRRTLQRSDIATAIQKSDVFDFLIDIVPREEAQPRRAHREPQHPIPSSSQPVMTHIPFIPPNLDENTNSRSSESQQQHVAQQQPQLQQQRQQHQQQQNQEPLQNQPQLQQQPRPPTHLGGMPQNMPGMPNMQMQTMPMHVPMQCSIPMGLNALSSAANIDLYEFEKNAQKEESTSRPASRQESPKIEQYIKDEDLLESSRYDSNYGF